MSMADGKVIAVIAGERSFQVCPVCGGEMNRLEELPAKHHDDLFELGQDVQLIVFVQVITAQGFFQAVPGEAKIRFSPWD